MVDVHTCYVMNIYFILQNETEFQLYINILGHLWVVLSD